jgi:hypothetical protein
MNEKMREAKTAEPRNPFYFLLLVSSLLFVVTALAYGLVPLLMQKTAEMGRPASPSPFRRLLVADGWKWLLYEVAAMAFFAILSMGLDRLRSLKKERREATMPSQEKPIAGEEKRGTGNPERGLLPSDFNS